MNLGSVLGFGGSNTGSNFQAGNVNLTPPATQAQANTAYDQVQSGLSQEQAFANALGAQNGIGNQTAALLQQQQLHDQLAGQNGVQNQSNTFAQQQALAQQLQQIAAGQGPNPAQAQLAQATGANVANQASLMAGQRGTNQNVGLIARQIAQQGAATQQQAAGQAATLQAQQSLAALGQLGGQQQNIQGVAATQIAQQQAQQQALQAAASNQVTQQAGALGNVNSLGQGEQQNLLGSLGQYNNAAAGMQQNINTTNAGIQLPLAQGQTNLAGGLIGGLGTAGQGFAKGGMIEKPIYLSAGGMGSALESVAPPSIVTFGLNQPGPKSFVGRFFKGYSDISNPQNNSSASATTQGGKAMGQYIGSAIANLFHPNPPVAPANTGLEYGEQYAAHGGKIMKAGGRVPGKGKKEDSIKRDTVPAELSPGEIVIPTHITMGKDPVNEGARFIAATLAKQNGLQHA